MQLRNANTTDLPFITEVYNEAVTSHVSTADTHPVGESYFEERVSRMKENRPLWIAEVDGEKVGWASFRDFYGRDGYAGTAEISIYLLKKYQHKGFGTFIINSMIRHAASMNIHTLVGFIFSENPGSIRLFEKAGFRQWGLLPDIAVIQGQLRSLCIMGRKIDPVNPS